MASKALCLWTVCLCRTQLIPPSTVLLIQKSQMILLATFAGNHPSLILCWGISGLTTALLRVVLLPRKRVATFLHINSWDFPPKYLLITQRHLLTGKEKKTSVQTNHTCMLFVHAAINTSAIICIFHTVEFSPAIKPPLLCSRLKLSLP